MIHEKLFGMVALAEPTPDLHWRMTPIAFMAVRLAEDRTGDMVVMVPDVRPLCLGIPVEIVAPSVYRASEIALGSNAPMVAL